MSLLIKDMKMPKCCNNCEFHWEEDVSFEIIHQCQVKTGYIDNADIHSFPYDCPLVELPEKHGRLIDADATMKQWGLDKATKYGNETAEQQHFSYSTMMMYEITDILDDALVVIEAEGE